jgi:hypothetical protein
LAADSARLSPGFRGRGGGANVLADICTAAPLKPCPPPWAVRPSSTLLPASCSPEPVYSRSNETPGLSARSGSGPGRFVRSSAASTAACAVAGNVYDRIGIDGREDMLELLHGYGAVILFGRIDHRRRMEQYITAVAAKKSFRNAGSAEQYANPLRRYGSCCRQYCATVLASSP